MDMQELKQAVDAMPSLLNNSNSKLQILAFDAPLMATVEVADQVKKGADIMVASEGTKIIKGKEPPTKKDSVNWNYEDLLKRLNKNPKQTAHDYSKEMVQSGAANNVDTISSMDLQGLDKLISEMDGLASESNLRGSIVPPAPPGSCPPYILPDRKGMYDYNSVNNAKDNVQTGVLDSRIAAQTFGGIIDFDVAKYSYDLDGTPAGAALDPKRKTSEDPVWGDMDFVDIYHFSQLVVKDARIKAAYKTHAPTIMQLLQKGGSVIIDEYHNKDAFPNAHGLSVYFPFQQVRQKADPIHEFSYDAPADLSSSVYHAAPGLLFPQEATWWTSLSGKMLKRYYTPVTDAETSKGKVFEVTAPTCDPLKLKVPVDFSGTGSSDSDFEGFASFGSKFDSLYQWSFGDGDACFELWLDKPASGNNNGNPEPSETVLACGDKAFDGKVTHIYHNCGCFVVNLNTMDDDGNSEIDWAYVKINPPNDTWIPPPDNTTRIPEPSCALNTKIGNGSYVPNVCRDDCISLGENYKCDSKTCKCVTFTITIPKNDTTRNTTNNTWSPPPKQYHNVCDYGHEVCTQVEGPGTNECTSDSQCKPEAPPPVCGNNRKEGTEQCDGTDLSGCSNGQTCSNQCQCLTPTPQYHNICSNYACTQVQGAGTNQCSSNSDCAPAQPAQQCGNNKKEGSEQCDGSDLSGCSPGQTCTNQCQCFTPPPQYHSVCDLGHGVCSQIEGAGSNECSSDSECRPPELNCASYCSSNSYSQNLGGGYSTAQACSAAAGESAVACTTTCIYTKFYSVSNQAGTSTCCCKEKKSFACTGCPGPNPVCPSQSICDQNDPGK
ncbi:hypothetical protein HY988_00390 [Candidatus Micrarchaeota archaeon]|nr:hypothetical protein [Candidatus Micrarchaeota archaeon]